MSEVLTRPKIIKRSNLALLSLFLILVGFFFISPNKASAAYSDMPGYIPEDPHQYINLTNGSDVNGVGANLPTGYLKFYTDTPGDKALRFDVIDRRLDPTRSCQNYYIRVSVLPLDPNSESILAVSHIHSEFISSCNLGYDVPIPWSAFINESGVAVPSRVRGHEGLYIAILQLDIVNAPNTSDHSATFHVGAQGGGKLGYSSAGGGKITIYPSQSGTLLPTTIGQNSSNPVAAPYSSANKPYHDMYFRFRPPCGVSQNQDMYFYDHDKNTANQDDSLWAEFKGINFSNGLWFNPPMPIPIFWNLQNVANAGGLQATIDSNNNYLLIFHRVQGGNGIQVKYPFDSNDAYLPCPNFDVTSLVSSAVSPWVEIGSSVDFIHTINSTSDSNTPPTFTGRSANLNYDPNNNNAPAGGSYNSTNRPGSIPLGAWTVSDNEKATKTVPNNAGLLNQSYCQRYAVDPKTVVNGTVTSGILVGNFACSTVVGGKTRPVANRSSGDELAENGEKVTFTAKLDTDNYTSYGGWGGYNIDCSWQITKRPRGAAVATPTGTSGTCDADIRNNDDKTFANPEFTIPNDLINYPIGTEICLVMNITAANSVSRSAAAGSPVNNPAFIGSPNPASTCFYVSAKPFVRAYMSDVITGGRFGQDGLLGTGDIKGYLRGTHAGSGIEFAAIAAGSVEGYASATMRDLATYPIPGKDLTFANTTLPLGSYFSAASRQVKDWFVSTMEESTKTAAPDTSTTASMAGLTAGAQTRYAPPAGSKLELTGGNAVRHTMYVEGDVVIKTDIIIPDATSYTDPDTVPLFSLIVKGNIYIASNVHRIDGLLVAQPKDVTTGPASDQGPNKDKNTGIVYTCTQADGTRYAIGALYDGCNSKLQINGALIAQKTKFLRTKGTLAEIKYTPGTPITTDVNANPVWVNNAADVNAALNKSNKNGLAGNPSGFCYKVQESLKISGNQWEDNWICTDVDVKLTFHDGGIWNGPASASAKCMSWNIGKGSWGDNYMCSQDDNLILFSKDGLTTAGYQCINITEPNDSDWSTLPSTPTFCIKSPLSSSTVTPEGTYEQLPFNTLGVNGASNAEEIRLSPEFYFGNPAFKPREDRSDGNGEYDSIITLPPIL